MAVVGDDRLTHVVPFLLEKLDSFAVEHKDEARLELRPLIVGLNGIQGCGKTTLVNQLREVLSSTPHNLNLVVFSIDDLYLPHDDQVKLAKANPSNPLVQHRGQPSTHDVDLCAKILASLRMKEKTVIPVYDKSAFNGKGDRSRDRSVAVDPNSHRVDIVLLEGWFIGFRALPPLEVERRWQQVCTLVRQGGEYKGRLGHNEIASIMFVNDELQGYDKITEWVPNACDRCRANYYSQLDTLIHIDAEDTHYVYDWRLEAEHAMVKTKGSGMTDEEVKTFVDGYYPSYELYTPALRAGAFPDNPGAQLHLTLDRNRAVINAERV